MQRPHAAETKRLIELLHRPVSFWESSKKHRVGTLALISQTRDPAAIPDIVLLLLDRDSDVARSAASAVSALVEVLRPEDLPWLDQVMRERSPYNWSYPSPWTELKPGQLKLLQRFEEESVFALGVASMHYSGYVRDEALRKLSDTQDGTELPFLLLRLNDWVQPVRQTALALVRLRVTSKYAPFFVMNIALVNRLRLARRGEQEGIVGEIEQLLRSEEGRTALLTGLASTDYQVKRACYKLGFGAESLHQIQLVEKALSEQDPAIRLQGAQRIASLSDPKSVEQLLSRAQKDRFAQVRRTVIETLCTKFQDKEQQWLEEALMDNHPSVRGYAQFQLGKEGSFKLRKFYIDALDRSEATTLPAVISGLGETGAVSDSDLVVPHLSSQIPRVRRAVLRTLARLKADAFVDVFQRYLSDDSRSVSREAMKGLSKTLHLTTGETLWSVFANAQELHVRRNVLFLIARLSKWESISYLLSACDSDAESLRNLADSYIHRWHARFNASFTAPSKPQVERLTAALRKCGAKLDSSVTAQIEFGIRGF
jgi:HEAT repeat protein